MEKMELSEALKANASVLEELMPIANLGSKGLLRKGVLSPILVCNCLLYTSPSPRDRQKSRMPSSA